MVSVSKDSVPKVSNEIGLELDQVVAFIPPTLHGRLYIGRIDKIYKQGKTETTIGTLLEYLQENENLYSVTRFPAHLTVTQPVYVIDLKEQLKLRALPGIGEEWYNSYNQQISRRRRMEEEQKEEERRLI